MVTLPKPRPAIGLELRAEMLEIYNELVRFGKEQERWHVAKRLVGAITYQEHEQHQAFVAALVRFKALLEDDDAV